MYHGERCVCYVCFHDREADYAIRREATAHAEPQPDREPYSSAAMLDARAARERALDAGEHSMVPDDYSDHAIAFEP